MKKLLPIFICVILCQTVAFAQQTTGTIKGIISDSAKAEPIPYVTLGLREAGQKSFIKSVYTDEKGAFRFTGLPFKNYELMVSFVGYKPEVIKIESLSPEKPEITLPAIRLKPASQQLKEVEISTQKMLVTQDLDKISYDVEADPESKTETVLEMLRKVPQVTVDADDNIKLKGSSSYRVLINGKTSTLFVQNPKDVLKNMPASSIKKIEVITNPPAKYEAEGVGGLINIITVKNSAAGYNGSINGGARLPQGYFGNAYFTVKTGKLGVDANYGRNTWTSPENNREFFRRETSGRQLRQDGTGKNNGGNQYGTLQLSFEADSLNLFTGGFTFYNGDNDIYSSLFVRTDSLGIPVQQYSQTQNGSNYWGGQDLTFDYQHSFRQKADQLLTVSYKNSTNGYGDRNALLSLAQLNYQDILVDTENENKEREHTVQTDYVQPFGKNSWEAGLKSIMRTNTSRFSYSTLGPNEDVFRNDPKFSNNFDYRQNIYAAYTSVKLNRDPWSLRLGGRFEETTINALFRAAEPRLKDDYFNFIPSVAVFRKLSETQDVKFSYGKRLERPGLWYLNPYVNQTDPKNISVGNPKLDATQSHLFELNYSTFIKSSSYNVSGFYNFTNNAIQSVTTLRGDTAITTFANTGKNRDAGLNLSSNISFSKKLNLNLNSSITYNWLNGEVGGQAVSNSGFTTTLYANGGYKFEKNWRINGNVGFFSRGVQLQGRGGGYIHSGFTLSKYFLKDNKANINLSVSNPFQRTRRWVNEVESPQFYQRQESQFVIRRVGMAFTYRFGALKGGIAKKKRGIENDDVKSGKSGGGN